MNREWVIDCLMAGGRLAARSEGWWMTPREKGEPPVRVPAALVAEMEKEGVLVVEMPYTTSHAYLADAAAFG